MRYIHQIGKKRHRTRGYNTNSGFGYNNLSEKTSYTKTKHESYPIIKVNPQSIGWFFRSMLQALLTSEILINELLIE